MRWTEEEVAGDRGEGEEGDRGRWKSSQAEKRTSSASKGTCEDEGAVEAVIAQCVLLVGRWTRAGQVGRREREGK